MRARTAWAPRIALLSTGLIACGGEGEPSGGAASSGGSSGSGGTAANAAGARPFVPDPGPPAAGGVSAAGGAGGSAGTSSTPPTTGGAATVLPDGGPATPLPDAAPPAVRPSTGPGDWGPGDYPPDILAQTYLEITGVPGQKGYTRQYKVHVPPGYDPSVPAPLVFCIHGLSQNAVMFCVQGAAFHEKSDEAGFVLVMPNGYQNSWNGGTCCGGASAEELDDVALFRAILDAVGQHVNVDLGRVYATGLSNGGFMSFRLACEAADVFTAVAPGAGAVGKNDIGGGTNPASDFTDCNPSEPVSVLAMHGTADGLVPYALHAPSMAVMAAEGGCSTATEPAAEPASAGDTTCVSRTGCPSGIEITGCSVEGGGHCWFGSPDCGTGGGPIGAIVVGANSTTLVNNDAVWAFFDRHVR